MLRAYVAAGFPPGDFWGLTPRLYLAHMLGASDRLEREHRNTAWLAWHVEALHRAKKLPEAKQFMSGGGTRAEEQGQVAIRLGCLRASLPRITQAQWRARFSNQSTS